jgi:TM2 domain-containing membrane protein YozV
MSLPVAAPTQSITTLRRKIGWCAIVLGAFGVHKFLLGYNKAGAIMLAVGVLGWFPFAIPTLIISAIGVIEGIIYLGKSDAEFEATYLRGKREWF